VEATHNALILPSQKVISKDIVNFFFSAEMNILLIGVIVALAVVIIALMFWPTKEEKPADTTTTQSSFSTDLNSTMNNLEKRALEEEFAAMTGNRMFAQHELPREPMTDDMFRYVGDYGKTKDDPLLNSPMVKTDIGNSNRGASIWDKFK